MHWQQGPVNVLLGLNAETTPLHVPPCTLLHCLDEKVSVPPHFWRHSSVHLPPQLDWPALEASSAQPRKMSAPGTAPENMHS